MNFVYYCGWRFFRTFYKVYFRAEWFNAERVPTSGPVILAALQRSHAGPWRNEARPVLVDTRPTVIAIIKLA